MVQQKTKTPLPLSEKEKAVLEFIEVIMADTGVAPSYQEIRDHFGFASFNSVQNYLKQLTQKGYIHSNSNQKRSIHILHPSHTVAERVQKMLRSKVLESEASFSIPLLGRVAAGCPIEEFENDEFIEVPPSLIRNFQKTFALKVKGTSMIDDGICDGDVILVQKQNSALNGEIVVASIENESTVKRFYFQKNPKTSEKMIELRPANSTLSSIWYSPEKVLIQGVVIGLIRKF